ncbi:S-adenosyl-L-methionine-dependent methyltransferase [Eremomyces bilateralis CBS 781.70]|uniref:S-adenosyl-L-methionine-dependent methyltransferase n=1 Tax=Eremomyces bilateralis CBS 781.70 TaxID=1392243 RepID=A0A6G1GD71_9PEZI|nr:S-adenosyl-L-methionine-dependent methyltransferase [Eremomyces bilateralis CBS 781.70]KAF1815856.1 S-adenosyl-L-methionine-dependent methyltransferase [Eremomyces bilateralis CBS 781.70]
MALTQAQAQAQAQTGQTQPAIGYAFPSPAQKIESNRLDVQHRLLVLTANDQLHRAPLDPTSVRNALDIATGTGIWATEFAREFPAANTVGFDITSHPQHSAADIPSNCTFEVADMRNDATWSGEPDANAAWTMPKSVPYDYVHGRMLMAVVQDWPKLMARCYEKMAPGAWIEFQDLNLPMSTPDPECTAESSPMFTWAMLFHETFLKIGYDFGAAAQHAQRLRDAGFVDVQEFDGKWTVAGPVPDSDRERQMHEMAVSVVIDGVAGFTRKAFKEVLGWTDEQVDEVVAAVQHESRNGKYRIIANFKYVFGRKPL